MREPVKDPMWETIKLYFVVICCTVLVMFLANIVATNENPTMAGIVIITISAPIGAICFQWMKEKADELRDQ